MRDVQPGGVGAEAAGTGLLPKEVQMVMIQAGRAHVDEFTHWKYRKISKQVGSGFIKSFFGSFRPFRVREVKDRVQRTDLQTVFLYLDSGNTIRQMRCVLFQAKKKPTAGDHVIVHEDIKQRQLYDECDGFKYLTSAVGAKNEE